MVLNHRLGGAASVFRLTLCLTDEFLDAALQRATLRLGASGDVLGQLGVKRARLAAGGVQAPVGVQITDQRAW